MRVTLHEVAARADVSIATVSRALNGLPVSAESRERVRLAAAELGYVANAAARDMRAERTMTLGMVFYDMQYAIDISLVDALSEAVEAQGYALLISTARGDPGRYELLMRRFLERRVDGLICFRPKGDGAILAACAAARVPVLTIYPQPGPFEAAATVRPRFRTGAISLADRLYELGHRRMLVVSLRPQARIFATVARAAEARGIAVETTPSPDDDVAELAASLAAGRASVVVTPDMHSRTLIRALAERGVRTPQDVSLVGLSNPSADSRRRNRAISTLMIDVNEHGREAGAAMLRWLGGAPPEAVSSVEIAAFEERGTTGPARG